MKSATAFLLLAAATLLPNRSPAQSIAPPAPKIERNLVFTSNGSNELKLNLYLPTPAGATNAPVVVLIYGGAWMMRNPGMEGPKAAWLAGHGYAVAVIDYRMSWEAVFPAQIYDCKAAVRWLRANAAKYRLDTDHIAAWGESSGAHLAALLGTSAGVAELEGANGNTGQSSQIHAVVDFFGPTDFLQMEGHAFPSSTFKHNAADSPESMLIGGPVQQNPDKVQLANPIKYITSNAPPFLVIHGEQDPLVPCHQSELLFAALKKAQAKVTFYKIAGAGHGGPEFQSSMTRAAVLGFLDANLKSIPGHQ